jgi:hypothetical protein
MSNLTYQLNPLLLTDVTKRHPYFREWWGIMGIFRRRQYVPPISLVVSEAEELGDDCWYVTAELIVGRSKLPAFEYGPLDLSELEASCNRPGSYFIWTCDCGCPSCAGRTKGVHVLHDNGLTYWHDLDSDQRYTFRLSDLTAALAVAWQEGRDFLARERRVACPEVNESFFLQPEPMCRST